MNGIEKPMKYGYEKAHKKADEKLVKKAVKN